ncbi:serine hydrolase [Miltoncostaea oceani]|uniref:serine hydrolase n=1 Tax=Miltoncostaea oceani TaxID=2843216 RepID=UPI001C3DAC6A|nr:serine hydrolase [Miltoncostaea oceani]
MPARPGARALVLAGVIAGTLAPSALATDAELLSAHRSLYPAAESAAGRASSPEGAQSAYDAARDLQEAVRSSAPVSSECRVLLRSLARYASGRVRQMEGIDRPSSSDVSAGRRSAEGARGSISLGASTCRTGGGGQPGSGPLMSPTDSEAFFGPIVARAPRRADQAELIVNGRTLTRVDIRSGRARFSLRGENGRYDIRIRFTRAGRTVGGVQARGAWLLGRNGLRSTPGSRSSSTLAAALSRATAGGPRYRSAWVQDLTTGEAAGINAGAAFPAASLVKLGLMAGTITKLGGAPARSAYAYDLKAMAGWSSNLANNHLLRRLGGAATAQEGLRRLGARSSTFPGEYIVGTELQPSLPGASSGGAPPSVSQRVTTAQDMGRMLYAIHASAVGAPGARAQTGLTAHQARLMLGWLLSSQQRADNVSMLAGGASGAPIAQKNGWINSARHGAGIIYTDRGPMIAVMLTYDSSGVSISQGQSLGSRIAGLVAR